MKRFAGLLQRIRGWTQDFGDAIQGKDLEALQTGAAGEERLLFLSPLAPGVVLMGRAGNGNSQK